MLLLQYWIMCTINILSEPVKHTFNLLLMRRHQLCMDLIEQLLLVCWHDVVLDLEQDIRCCIDDLVLELDYLGVAIVLKHIDCSLLLCDLFNKVIHDLCLFTVVSFEAPLKSLLDYLNYSAFGACLTCCETWSSVQIVKIKAFIATSEKSWRPAIFELLIELAILLFDKVLDNFDSGDNDLLKDSLTLIHLDQVSWWALREVKLIEQLHVVHAMLVICRCCCVVLISMILGCFTALELSRVGVECVAKVRWGYLCGVIVWSGAVLLGVRLWRSWPLRRRHDFLTSLLIVSSRRPTIAIVSTIYPSLLVL